VDLDLAQVRAFVVVAEELHFGKAARRLFLTQQALSKRVARLEGVLGVALFTREHHHVELTPAGRRFLEPARQVLAGGDIAVAAARLDERQLRLDMWGHLYGPARTVSAALDAVPDLAIELGHSRDLPAAIGALSRGEADVGFGRVHPGVPTTTLVERVVRREPVDVVLGAAHPLADRTSLRPADLRDSVLWCPAALPRLDFLASFAEEFAVPTAAGGANLGLDHLLADLRADPRRVFLLPVEVRTEGVMRIPLVEPTPLYAWSLVWRAADRNPALGVLLRAFADAGDRDDWLAQDGRQHWLPGEPVRTR
jgi:DNA-binding transcriptional LysR family regulator